MSNSVNAQKNPQMSAVLRSKNKRIIIIDMRKKTREPSSVLLLIILIFANFVPVMHAKGSAILSMNMPVMAIFLSKYRIVIKHPRI